LGDTLSPLDDHDSDAIYFTGLPELTHLSKTVVALPLTIVTVFNESPASANGGCYPNTAGTVAQLPAPRCPLYLRAQILRL